MHLSLFTKMRELERVGILGRERDPEIHYFPGEGRQTYNGKKIEYLNDYIGPAPDNSKLNFDEPTDVAWCPEEGGKVIAFAPSNHEPFQPLKERITIRKPK